MSEFARVDSIEALKELRVSLCKFAEAVDVGLGEAESEIQHTAIWLKQEQQAYWKAQIHKRTELVTRAKIELNKKKLQKTPLGGRYSCVDEEKALAAAQRRLDQAEQKLANVGRWIRQLEQEAFSYRGLVQGLGQAVGLDVPNAVARLDSMIDALESYVSIPAPSEEGTIADGRISDHMSRPEEVPPGPDDAPSRSPIPAVSYQTLRGGTPRPEVRDRTPAGEPTLNWPQQCEISKSQREAVGGLDCKRIPPAPNDKVVMARGSWNHPRVYLERVEPSRRGDCGWYIGFADGTRVDDYESVRVADLVAMRPDLAEILALPIGYLVVLDRTSIEAVLDPQGRILWPSAGGTGRG